MTLPRLRGSDCLVLHQLEVSSVSELPVVTPFFLLACNVKPMGPQRMAAWLWGTGDERT